MKVYGFIPDWPGEKQHAARTAKYLMPYCETVFVLDNPDHYFTEQWETARKVFDQRPEPDSKDILLWVMADVWPPQNFGWMFSSMKALMTGKTERLDPAEVGVYAPDVRWCGWQYDVSKLPQYSYQVYEVPCTDMLCWAVRADVLAILPHVDPAVNRLGWGIDLATVAAAKSLGLKVVRDYNYRAGHPRHTNYDGSNASVEMEAWFATLDPGVLAGIREATLAAQTIAIHGTTVANDPIYTPSAEDLKRDL